MQLKEKEICKLEDIRVEREKMTREKRAKQFLPFSAVSGLEEALERKRKEIEREDRVFISEEKEREINDTLISLEKNDRVRIKYYNGIKYETKEGVVIKKNEIDNTILLENEEIYLPNIASLEKIKNSRDRRI